LTGLRADGLHNALDNTGIMQEVLSEAFACLVHQRAISTAFCMAATRRAGCDLTVA